MITKIAFYDNCVTSNVQGCIHAFSCICVYSDDHRVESECF